MTNTLDAKEFQSELQRLDNLLRGVDRLSDPAAQSHVRAIVRAVLDLHGAGLERLLDHLDNGGETGRALLDTCARDEIISGLLLLHGLHPLDVEQRVRQALDSVRPYLRSHGGNVELLGVNDGVVRLRLEGSCHSCRSSSVTMTQTIEEAIFGRAPEVSAVQVERTAHEAASDGSARVALPVLS